MEDETKNIVYLFALKESQNLIMYKIDNSNVKNSKLMRNDNKNLDYFSIQDKIAGGINKQDIFLDKKNKIIVVTLKNSPD